MHYITKFILFLSQLFKPIITKTNLILAHQMQNQAHQTTQHEFPSSQFIQLHKTRSFSTLHQAIKLVHSAAHQSGHPLDRYCLKSFNGHDMHLLQCSREGCQSFILVKSRRSIMSNNLNQGQRHVEFQFFDIGNSHVHKQYSRGHQANDCQSAENQQIIDCRIQQDLNHCQAIDKLQYLKYSLKKHNISMHFRDFLNCFISPKDQQYHKLQSSLPYHLPQIMTFPQVQVSFCANYKCLNEKKKTYFYMMEVYAFDQIVTEVKFVASNKTRNPQVYLYILVLIYIMLNDLKNCKVSMKEDMLMEITRERLKDHSSYFISGEQIQFIQFVKDLEKTFFSIHHETRRNSKQNQFLNLHQRPDFCRKQIYPLNEISDFNNKNTTLSINQLQRSQTHTINTKTAIAENIYKQATLSSTQWRINEQKPSIIRKLNSLFDRQQKQRLKKRQQKEITSYQQDNNIINLIELQQDQNLVDSKEKSDAINSYMANQQMQHLKHALDQLGGIDFQEWGGIQKLQSTKQWEGIEKI